MKSASLSLAFGLILGAAGGATAAWFLLKKNYELMAQEEIDAIKEAYQKKASENITSEEEEKTTDPALKEKPDIMAYAAKLKGMGYTNYNGMSEETENKEDAASEPIMEDGAIPYVIPPEEYGELDDYEKISLTHYSDGTLADIHDNVIDDVDEIVGSEYYKHFGEYEDDSVFIRNDAKKCDYEILYDERTWDDILAARPYLAED